MGELETFYAHRTEMLSIAYRMLADLDDAEDVLREAWLRWQRRQVRVESPGEFLVSLVKQICVSELGARARRAHRESRPSPS